MPVLEGQQLVDASMALAIRAHEGQTNKHDGEPYVLHPYRVYCSVRDGGLDYDHQALALLHDTIEDTWVTYDYLMKEGWPIDVISALHAISKIKGESNEQYYLRVKQNLIARRVKVHDINENFGRNHLVADAATRERMAKKYSLGLDILCRTQL